MTQFAEIELLYKQFFNIAEEISKLVKSEDYNEIELKLKYKDKLIHKFISAKNNLVLSDSEKIKMAQLEKQLLKFEEENIAFITELQKKVGLELKKTKNNIKIKSAYKFQQKENNGTILDFSE